MVIDAAERHNAKEFLLEFESKSRRRGKSFHHADRAGEVWLNRGGSRIEVSKSGDLDFTMPEVELFYESGVWRGACKSCKQSNCGHIYGAVLDLLDGREAKTAPPPKPSLTEKLESGLGRKLNAKETKFVARVEHLHRLTESGQALCKWDLQDIANFDYFNAPYSVKIAAVGETDTLEFWQHLARFFHKYKGVIPEFMSSVTDWEEIQRETDRAQWQMQVAQWRGVLEQINTAIPAEKSDVCDLRLCLSQAGVEVQLTSSKNSAFKTIKSRQWQGLSQGVSDGRVILAPEALRIFTALSAEIQYSTNCQLSLVEKRVQRILSLLFRSPELRSRLVTSKEEPFEFSADLLEWKLEEVDEKYYRLRLTLPDGKTAPPFLVILPGAPYFYVGARTVHEGPAKPPDFTVGPHLIPAPALETSSGLRMLESLKLPMPPRISARVKRVEMQVKMSCRIVKEKYSGIEICHLDIKAQSKEGKRTDKLGHAGWYAGSEGNNLEGSDLYQFERGVMDAIPSTMELLGAKYDHLEEKWSMKVSKQFPERFLHWHQQLPGGVEFKLDAELQSLVRDPVKAKIQLECEDVGVDWFDLRTSIKVEDTTLTPEEINLLLNAKGKSVRLPGKGWRRLEYDLSEEEDQTLAKLGLSALDFSGEPQRLHALQLADAAAESMLAAKQFQKIQERAKEIKTRVTPEIPAGVTATLRPYQLEGFHFLAYLSENRFGGILADDMGLGKTIQTLTWLAWIGANGGKQKCSLVVCPKSVMDNWLNEAAKFVPELKVKLWRSAEGEGLNQAVKENQILVMNYSQLRNISEKVAKIEWGAVILDEGQYIKNPDSQTAQAARALRCDHRLALSGTPIENRLLDLWSLMAFAMPGVLGNRMAFKRRFDQASDPLARRRLAARVRPFLLRRTKNQVAKDLPDRTEEDLTCEMDGVQKTLYRAEFKRAQQMLLKVQTQKDLNDFRFNFLTSLLRLRQICCHPALVSDEHSLEESAKLNALMDVLEPVMEEGHKVLVFSQFVGMLKMIRQKVEENNWGHFYLDGSSEDRGELVENFQKHEGAAVFLISLKAGGFGLNLTAASYVVIYDPWWNPAVENQAIDRTHRIGQTQKVIAYRLITKNSIEEKIRGLQKKKAILAENVLGDEAFASSLTMEDFQYLFQDDQE